MSRPGTACGAAALAASLALFVPVPSPAATNGLSYDSVTKFQKAGDAQAAPGSFATDFAAAAQASGSGDDAPRGPFGLGRAIAQAKNAVATFKTGSAQHEYVAGSKQRIDHIALGTAEIVDCAARTLTTLDLKKKTYTVTSLDAPAGRPGRHAAPGPASTDDGSKVAVSVTTKSLGSKNIDGTPAAGYDSDLKTTVTKPDSEPKTFEMELTAYYSPYAKPALTCPTASHSGTQPGPGGDAMAQYALAMRALRPGGSADGRFTATSSGPALPAGRLALWEVVAMKGEQHDAAFGIVMERGNVHTIAEADPIFSVPADFTKE